MRRLASAVLVLAAACGGARSSPSTPTPTPVASPTATAAPHALEVVLRFGPLTSVMDSPRGQVEKAEAILRRSDLVAQLTAYGYQVSYAGDVHLPGDLVIVEDRGEIGRAQLDELTAASTPPALLEVARAHANPEWPGK
jgi:hypothetical protein